MLMVAAAVRAVGRKNKRTKIGIDTCARLKYLDFLMTYPQDHHKEVLGECAQFLKDEQWLSPKASSRIDLFLQGDEKPRSSGSSGRLCSAF
jgi:hypothetical protein